MDSAETLPIRCPHCRHATRKPVRWVQENIFLTCPSCGASSLIDKDEAAKIFAEMTRPHD